MSNPNAIPPEHSKFKPGQSGNPKGKPKGIPDARTRYLRLLALTEKIANPVTGELEEFSIMEQLDMKMIAKARKGDLNAYKEIMDRLEGKAPQSLNIKDNRPDPIGLILAKFGLLEDEGTTNNDRQITESTEESS